LRYVVGITGASGTIYGQRLVEVLLLANHRVDLIVTDAGFEVGRLELGWETSKDNLESNIEFLNRFYASRGVPTENLRVYDLFNIASDIASGSVNVEAMIVVPCSMGTLASIATGQSGNLLERVADVMLKEKRQLVLVPRETPFSTIHLRNLLTVAEAGAHVLPAMPGFYHRPETLEDVVDFVVGKILNTLNLPQDILQQWMGD